MLTKLGIFKSSLRKNRISKFSYTKLTKFISILKKLDSLNFDLNNNQYYLDSNVNNLECQNNVYLVRLIILLINNILVLKVLNVFVYCC